jgi:hypothetical protein
VSRRIEAAFLVVVMTLGNWLAECGSVLLTWAFERMRKRATEGENDD